jgi:aspartyl protease family protein
MTQRHLIGEVVSWLVVAGLLFALAQNTQLLRRVVGELTASRTTQTARPAARPPLPDDSAERVASREGVELRADRGGHYETAMEINGRPLQGMVDTGATLVVLTYDDARSAGIFLHDSDFTMASQTANGIARFAPVMLDRVAIGSILVRNVKAGVAEPGALRTNLIGMSFLQRLQKFEIRSGTLLLQD